MPRDLPKKCGFTKEDYTDFFLPRYRKNPLLFATEICGIEPGGWQIGFLQTLVEDMDTPHGARIALASGHETGKTFISCIVMFWGVCVLPDCHVYCTSATKDQLVTRLWSYMKRIISESAISGWFEVDSEKAIFKHLPGNFIRAQGWSKDKPQSWAGEHCHAPWAVFDECSDIDTEIFNAWSGSANKWNSLTLIMGQPRLRSGKLFDAFDKEREFWRGIHLSSLDSPFASKRFIEEARSKFGEDSDYYRVRVLGMFPKADNSQLFPDARYKKAEAADLTPSDVGEPPLVAGLDIAAGGADKTTLLFRSGDKVLFIEKFDSGDHPALMEAIASSMLRKGCGVVAADSIGYGYGLVKFLSEHKEITVVPVNGSMKAINQRKYHNRRSEAYGRLSENFNKLSFVTGGVKQNDLEDICRQLESIKISYDKDMRIAVLPKSEIKEEIGESPDLADALAYSFMASHEHGQTPEAQKAKMLEIHRIQMNSNPYRR